MIWRQGVKKCSTEPCPIWGDRFLDSSIDPKWGVVGTASTPADAGILTFRGVNFAADNLAQQSLRGSASPGASGSVWIEDVFTPLDGEPSRIYTEFSDQMLVNDQEARAGDMRILCGIRLGELADEAKIIFAYTDDTDYYYLRVTPDPDWPRGGLDQNNNANLRFYDQDDNELVGASQLTWNLQSAGQFYGHIDIGAVSAGGDWAWIELCYQQVNGTGTAMARWGSSFLKADVNISTQLSPGLDPTGMDFRTRWAYVGGLTKQGKRGGIGTGNVVVGSKVEFDDFSIWATKLGEAEDECRHCGEGCCATQDPIATTIASGIKPTRYKVVISGFPSDRLGLDWTGFNGTWYLPIHPGIWPWQFTLNGFWDCEYWLRLPTNGGDLFVWSAQTPFGFGHGVLGPPFVSIRFGGVALNRCADPSTINHFCRHVDYPVDFRPPPPISINPCSDVWVGTSIVLTSLYD